MPLVFPNPSRAYDETRKAVRFSGHDGMFEISFFVEVDALTKSSPQTCRSGSTEACYLLAFDMSRRAIYAVAQKIYSRNRNNMLTLTAADFR